MLLGHWYLVQPGLPRGPLLELVRWTGRLWPFELVALLWPTGMVSVLAGTVDDGYGGLLGWFWLACTVASIALVAATRAALRERQYSAAQQHITTLADTFTMVDPDVVLMMGDDQGVFIDDGNRPAIMVYRGETFPTFIQSTTANQEPSKPAIQIPQPVAVSLSEHIIKSLVDQEFDIADSAGLELLESNQQRGGHEFGWAYNRLMRNQIKPIVPFILNVHYPLTTPSPKRCYEFGQAIRRAIQEWPGNERVAVIGTGGLSVGVLEEDLDRNFMY